MNDWSNCDPRLLKEVEPVVWALSEIISPEQIMVVGAQCRDLLSWYLNCNAPRRRTNDTDVALALRNWGQLALIRQRFRSLGSTGYRFLIRNVETDVVPFGEIESPAGVSSQPPGKEALNVHGFVDAYQRADQLQVSPGVYIRIPRPEGYAVLKTHAWLDRSARYEYKDGPDLALVVHWYAEDLDRIYAEESNWALDLHDFDLRRAAAALLGRSMRNCLSPNELAALRGRVSDTDRDLLARNFGAGAPDWPAADSERRGIVDAMLDQLSQ